jgi:hypothetical protein
VDVLHINGYKSNQANFGNLLSAMENMKYLAGIFAGSRAATRKRTGAPVTLGIPNIRGERGLKIGGLVVIFVEIFFLKHPMGDNFVSNVSNHA